MFCGVFELNADLLQILGSALSSESDALALRASCSYSSFSEPSSKRCISISSSFVFNSISIFCNLIFDAKSSLKPKIFLRFELVYRKTPLNHFPCLGFHVHQLVEKLLQQTEDLAVVGSASLVNCAV